MTMAAQHTLKTDATSPLASTTGTDLDYMIKTHKVIPERDARAIMMQILAGLRYLNTPSGSRQVCTYVPGGVQSDSPIDGWVPYLRTG